MTISFDMTLATLVMVAISVIAAGGYIAGTGKTGITIMRILAAILLVVSYVVLGLRLLGK